MNLELILFVHKCTKIELRWQLAWPLVEKMQIETNTAGCTGWVPRLSKLFRHLLHLWKFPTPSCLRRRMGEDTYELSLDETRCCLNFTLPRLAISFIQLVSACGRWSCVDMPVHHEQRWLYSTKDSTRGLSISIVWSVCYTVEQYIIPLRLIQKLGSGSAHLTYNTIMHSFASSIIFLEYLCSDIVSFRNNNTASFPCRKKSLVETSAYHTVWSERQERVALPTEWANKMLLLCIYTMSFMGRVSPMRTLWCQLRTHL